MEPILNQANIVIVAPNHNPEIVSKEWLVKNDIFKEDIISFSPRPNRVLAETANYSINAVQQRLTISTRNSSQDKLDNLETIANQYINALPNLSYNAAGLNSNWAIQPIRSNLLKGTFVANQEKFDKMFQKETDYDIGGIVHYQHNLFRVQLLIPPQQNNQIIADFNYHSDITNFSQLRERISCFSEALGHARDTIRKLLGD